MRLLKPFLAVLLSVVSVLPCLSQETVPLTLKGETETIQVDKVVVTKEDRLIVKSFPFQVVAPPDIGFYYWSYPATTKVTDKGNVLEVLSAPKGDLKVDLKVQSAVIDGGKIKYLTQFSSIVVAIGEVAPPTPVPPEPGPEPKPKPKPPVPQPTISFRVIFVYESSKNLTSAQLNVMDAKVVRDYLTANTTPESGLVGWRKYDKDQDSSKDAPTINTMWQAVQPKVTSVPCVAVEVNGRVEIIPLDATPAAMVETFKKYKGGI